LFEDIGIYALEQERDRVMLCGSPEMIKETRDLLDQMGFIEGNHGEPGHFVIEKAFVER
jgi:ferredoxin/flavodoxin---NADP+ reductase